MASRWGHGRWRGPEGWTRALSTRWWPWVLAFGGVAVVLTLTNAAGAYVFDNRFEQYWNPGQRVAKGLTVWDATRGLGRARDEFWPGATLPIWGLHALGLPVWVCQRLWHAVLISTGALGAMSLVRRVVPDSVPTQAIAGTWYAFGPFSAVFLTPSNLYLHYALAPWFAVIAVRALRGGSLWRAAAATGLLVFALGNVDPPGLAYIAVTVAVVSAHVVTVERMAGVGRLFALGWRTALLVLATSAAAIAKTAIAASAFSERLATTESPVTAGLASSWPESLRGLGFWVSYLRIGGGPLRAEEVAFFDRPWLVLVTFAVPVVALGALWSLRSGSRVLFGALMAVGAFVMVGPHPVDDPAPWGRIWLWAARTVPGFAGLRSTYKVGSAYSLGVAALFAMGAVAAGRAAARRGDLPRRAVIGATALAVTLGAFPFWTGNLYSPDLQVDGDVPTYWTEAMDWLDARPGDSRVLILPGATRARYRWGSPGDDILDAFLARPHALDVSIPLTTPVPAELLEAIDSAVVDAGYVAGSLAPVLRRIGVEYVLLRNDLAWESMSIARPSRYDALRSDPGLTPVRTFGRPGQQTVRPGSAPSAPERRLPPIEILRVDDAPTASEGQARVSTDDWMLLDGGGAGWLQAAAAGLLDGDAPVVAAASLDEAVLRDALERGSRLVVTDSNRRSGRSVSLYTASRSATLRAGEELGRVVPDLYGRPGSQTEATFGGDARIVDPDAEQALIGGFRPQFRAAQAFDGDLSTGWVVSSILGTTGRRLQIELPGGRRIRGISVVAYDPSAPGRAVEGGTFSGVPRPGRVHVRLSNGDEHDINVITGRGSVEFATVEVSGFELEIADVTAEGDVGLAEIVLAGDAEVSGPGGLAEWIRLPDSTVRRARADRALADAVRSAPLSVLMTRVRGVAAQPIENRLRREVDLLHDRSFAVRGALAPTDELEPVDEAACIDVGLRIDDATVPVRVADDGTFLGCEEVTLAAGLHRLWDAGSVTVDRLELSDDGSRSPTRAVGPSAPGSVSVVSTGDSSRTFAVEAPSGSLLVTGDAFDARWTATAAGDSLGAPLMADAQVAWVVPASSPVEVRAAFAPARTFRLSLAVTAMGLAVCGALLLRRGPR